MATAATELMPAPHLLHEQHLRMAAEPAMMQQDFLSWMLRHSHALFPMEANNTRIRCTSPRIALTSMALLAADGSTSANGSPSSNRQQSGRRGNGRDSDGSRRGGNSGDENGGDDDRTNDVRQRTPKSEETAPEVMPRSSCCAADLSDDIWIIIVTAVAAIDYRDLLATHCVSRRFARLASSNSCWFAAYKATYPNLTRSVVYRGFDLEPPDWRSKFAASVIAVKAWDAFAKDAKNAASRSPPSQHQVTHQIALETFEGNPYNSPEGSPTTSSPSVSKTSGALGLPSTPPTTLPRPAQSTSTSEPPISPPSLSEPITEAPWSFILGEQQIADYILRLHSNPDARFAYASMIPEYHLEFPTAATGELGTGILGISVLHRVGLKPSPEIDDLAELPQGGAVDPGLRTSVFFVSLPSLHLIAASSFLTAGPQRGWNWLVLRHVDSRRDMFTLAEEDEREGRWSRLVFRTISGSSYIGDEKAEEASSDYWTESILKRSKKYSSYSGRDVVSTSDDSGQISEFVLPASLLGYSIISCPAHITTCPFNMPSKTNSGSSPISESPESAATAAFDPLRSLLLLGVSDEEVGTVLTLDPRNPQIQLARSTFGSEVTIIDANPFPSPPATSTVLILTGHIDHRVRVWDLLNGNLLVNVAVPNSSVSPVLGVGWIDEPEEWFGHAKGRRLRVPQLASSSRTDKIADHGYRCPRGMTLVSFADLEDEETGGGTGSFAVWDLHSRIQESWSAMSSSSSSSSVAATQVKRKKNAVSTMHNSLAKVSVAGETPDDVVSTFIVVHPLMCVYTSRGTFEVVNLETGASVVRLLGVGSRSHDDTVDDDREDFSDQRNSGDEGDGVDEDNTGDVAANQILAGPAGGAESVFAISCILRAPDGGMMLLTGAGVVKINVRGL